MQPYTSYTHIVSLPARFLSIFSALFSFQLAGTQTTQDLCTFFFPSGTGIFWIKCLPVSQEHSFTSGPT